MVVAAFKNDIPSFQIGLSESAGSNDDHLRDLEIAGAVNGNIAGRTITILKTGFISGSVGADTVVISGTVNGSISAHNIELLATARVEGELHYNNLTVKPGAHMQTQCIPTAA
jgi:cytoskeletal protein CcmA (bactofilin family)